MYQGKNNKTQNKGQKQFYDNYCQQLLTGKFESIKAKDGTISRVFTPSRANKYSPLSLIIKMKQGMDENVSIQAIKEDENIILPAFSMDYNIFTKTKEEKFLSKRAKKAYKTDIKAKSGPFMAQRAEMIKTIINPQKLPNWGAGGFIDILI